VINRLGERAENIGSILTVIEDITDQTGLLALNAGHPCGASRGTR